MGNREIMGLVGCLVLGDEMAFVLEQDESIESVYIVDNDEGRAFYDKLSATIEDRHIELVERADLNRIEQNRTSVIAWIKPSSLHDDPTKILDELTVSARGLENICGSILMFYGLCRNTKQQIKRFVESFSVPVTFLTDEDGSVADDCFGAILGGRARYLETIRNNKGTMFMTTGYAENWARKQEDKGLVQIMEQVENFQLLFKTLGYTKVLVLDTGLGDREEFRRRVKVFASVFDFTIETTRCDISLLERSYRLAKAKLAMPVSPQKAGEEAVFSRPLL